MSTTAPFLDPALIVEALQFHLPLGLVDSVGEIANPDQAASRRALAASRALFVTPYSTRAQGPEGTGNGRMVQETLGVVIQWRTAGIDAGLKARGAILTVRQAIWDVLEGVQVDPDWAHLRYLGGELLDLGDDPGLIYRWIELYQTDTPAPVRRRVLPTPP
jgi:hypothetical protein